MREDGSVIIEQVSESGEMQLPKGIIKREFLVTQELYPNIVILKETINKVKTSYDDPVQQAHKSVLHLELEKKAIVELIKMVNKI